MLKEESPNLLNNKLHFYNQLAIEDLNCYITEHCWKYIAKESTCDESDHSKFADIFSCLLLLNNYDINDLTREFYAKQMENINNILQSNLALSFLLESLLNIVMNTIKCSRVFYQDSNYEALIVERYRKIINSTFTINSFKHSGRLIDRYLHYKIAIDLNNDSSKLNRSLAKDEIQEWIQLVKREIVPSLELKVRNIASITEIFSEIDSTEKKLLDDYRFSQMDDYVEIIDVNTSIWKECIKEIFESRIYEIAQEKLDAVINELEILLDSFEKDLFSDTNLAEFVWKDSNFNNKNNDFMNLITKSCSIASNGFTALLNDIVVLKENYHNYLAKIYVKIFDFVKELENRINLTQETKQFILFGAIFFEKFPQQCSSIRAIFELHKTSSSGVANWDILKNQFKTISDLYFCKWFKFIITDKFQDFLPEVFVDLATFLQNLIFWEKVSINDEQVSDKSVNTVIEVPIQISLCSFNVIQNVCSDINRHCAYTLSRTVLVYILSLIGDKMLSVYQLAIEQIQSCQYPQTAKQVISIQLYFDLLFLKNLFIKEETLRTNQLAKINNLLSALESMIDPFDLHIMFPCLKANSDNLFKSCSIIFGFLFTDKNLNGSFKVDSKSNLGDFSKEVKHNIMLINNCDFHFDNL